MQKAGFLVTRFISAIDHIHVIMRVFDDNSGIIINISQEKKLCLLIRITSEAKPFKLAHTQQKLNLEKTCYLHMLKQRHRSVVQ